MSAALVPESLHALNVQMARLREKVSFYREHLPEGGLRSLDDVAARLRDPI